jgi:hypothetical protein
VVRPAPAVDSGAQLIGSTRQRRQAIDGCFVCAIEGLTRHAVHCLGDETFAATAAAFAFVTRLVQ